MYHFVSIQAKGNNKVKYACFISTSWGGLFSVFTDYIFSVHVDNPELL